jgi:glutathione S-transferase
LNATAAPYRFHGFDVSYFSGKVRPALRYKGLWVEERRANVREILKRTGLAYIPVLETPEGEIWQDSTEILEALEQRHPDPPLFPRTAVQRMAAQLVELYVDEFGTIPAMHYRWGSELGEASARARFAAMTGSAEIGKLAADAMVAARRAVGATEQTAPAIEAHTRDLLDALSTHFEAQPYLLGERMSFADCALMGPLYAHLFVDLVPRRLLLESAVPVVGWIERCNVPHPDEPGEWLGDDALSPTFREVLRVMGSDAAPVILSVLRSIEAWADERPPELEAPPRTIGACEIELRGKAVKKAAGSYTLWMVARTLDAYRNLDEAERARVDRALAGTGWEELLAYEPRHRFVKDGFQLAFG